jgi:hypothetical protein
MKQNLRTNVLIRRLFGVYLPVLFSKKSMFRGEDCMFRALALCRGVRASTTHKVRTAIVKHICDQVNDGGEYWNDDCMSLLWDETLIWFFWFHPLDWKHVAF